MGISGSSRISWGNFSRLIQFFSLNTAHVSELFSQRVVQSRPNWLLLCQECNKAVFLALYRSPFIALTLADKLFPVNTRAITGPPKISLQLEARSTPALIIKPRLILVAHTDDLSWFITSNQSDTCSFKPQRQQTKCYVKANPVLHHRLYSNWHDVSGKLSY